MEPETRSIREDEDRLCDAAIAAGLRALDASVLVDDDAATATRAGRLIFVTLAAITFNVLVPVNVSPGIFARVERILRDADGDAGLERTARWVERGGGVHDA